MSGGAEDAEQYEPAPLRLAQHLDGRRESGQGQDASFTLVVRSQQDEQHGTAERGQADVDFEDGDGGQDQSDDSDRQPMLEV